MKRKNVRIQIVTNILLFSILAILAAFCLPTEKSEAVFAPYYGGEEGTGRVGIMINVYEGTEQVKKILEILDKTDTTCTFFVGGVWAEKNLPLLKEMALHAEIGNHGYLHRDHAKISKQANKEEILLCHNLVHAAANVDMKLFAPPSGSFSDDTLSVCEENDYKVIMWSKDTIDWRDHDKDLIIKRATTDVKGGDLILMHPTEETVKALPSIIEFYKKEGLLPSTVSDVIGVKSYY
ncbi:MAG: polysaccharide deacetylase family protein [Clostridia bacterium]|nr:polysaccharide deacetylase family protein [Clostridia bacterium]